MAWDSLAAQQTTSQVTLESEQTPPRCLTGSTAVTVATTKGRDVLSVGVVV